MQRRRIKYGKGGKRQKQGNRPLHQSGHEMSALSPECVAPQSAWAAVVENPLCALPLLPKTKSAGQSPRRRPGLRRGLRRERHSPPFPCVVKRRPPFPGPMRTSKMSRGCRGYVHWLSTGPKFHETSLPAHMPRRAHSPPVYLPDTCPCLPLCFPVSLWEFGTKK